MSTANFIASLRSKTLAKRLGFLLVFIAFIDDGHSLAANLGIQEPALILRQGKGPTTARPSTSEIYIQSLQQSMGKATQWAHSKPNDETLWSRLRLSLENILYSEWMKGRLVGAKPTEAYFVYCDRNTMTQNDIDRGRAICSVGIAPLRPAEFMEFRFEQKTAAAR